MNNSESREILAQKLVNKHIFFQLRNEISFRLGLVIKNYGHILEINLIENEEIDKVSYYSINDMLEIQVKD